MSKLSAFKVLIFSALISFFLLSSTGFLIYRAVQFDKNYPNPLPQALTEKSIKIEDGSGSDSKCDLPPDPGNCKASFEKYYYNKSTGSCEAYTYGGCGAEVPFDTLEACEVLCINP